MREVQDSLAETLEALRRGEIKAGEAYAAGYLAQLALSALDVERRESKLDVKHFWEVVDLGAAFEKAAELAKERKKEQAATPSASPQDREAEEAEEDETAARDKLAGATERRGEV